MEEKLATYGVEVRLKEAEGYTPFDRVPSAPSSTPRWIRPSLLITSTM
jgi:hypothetical protein